jgi:hypothetical protein
VLAAILRLALLFQVKTHVAIKIPKGAEVLAKIILVDLVPRDEASDRRGHEQERHKLSCSVFQRLLAVLFASRLDRPD